METYKEKIATAYVSSPDNDNYPVVVIETKSYPVNYAVPVSILLFMLEFNKTYKIKTEIKDKDGRLLVSSKTEDFLVQPKDVTEDKVTGNNLFSSKFDLRTALVNIVEPGSYEIKITLESREIELDSITTYFVCI